METEERAKVDTLQNKNRIEWIDIAKGIGILLVLLTHADTPYFSRLVYTFHMPLFFFLSGYLFKYADDTKSFLVNKLKRLLIPYFSYGFLIILFDLVKSYANNFLHLKSDYDVGWEFFRIIVIQNRYTTLWFLSVLLLLNISLYFLMKVTHSNFKIINIVVLLFCILGCIYYRTNFMFFSFNGTPEAMPWNIDCITTAMPFYYAGYLIKINKHSLSDKINHLVKDKYLLFGSLFVIVGLAFGVAGYFISGNTLEMYAGEYAFEPFTFISAFTCILGICVFSKALHFAWLKYIGKNSMVYFAIHQSIVYSLLNNIFKALNLFQGELPLYITYFKAVLMTVLALIICTIFNEIFKRIKVTKFLFGLR